MSYANHQEYVEAVRHANPLVDVAKELLGAPGGAGPSWVCPWHPDTRPSLSLNLAKGFFKCFGCNLHGDVFTLVELKEGLRFTEAVAWLANRAGLPSYKPHPAAWAEAEAARAADTITSRVAEYYHSRLTDEALAYLTNQRGLPEDQVREEFQLGWADGTAAAWVETTHGPDWLRAMELAGLVQEVKNSWQPDAPTHRDRFFERVIFPCFKRGQTTFMSGRTLAADVEPKYLHQRGREAPLYPTDDDLPPGRVYLVEGPIDALSLRAWGYPAYALQGGMRAGAIRKLTPVRELYACFDGDRAGTDAALKLAAGLGVSRVKIVSLPDGHDPNDLYRAGAREVFSRLVQDAYSPIAFALRYVPKAALSMDTLELLQPALRLLAASTELYAETVLETNLKPRFSFTKELLVAARAEIARLRQEHVTRCPACGTTLLHA